MTIRVIGTVLAAALLASCATQRSQPPEYMDIPPRSGLTVSLPIDIVTFDGRIDRSYSNELQAAVIQQIKMSYPNVKCDVLSPSQYYQRPNENRITIKVAIAAYGADFGTKVTTGIGTIGGKFVTGLVPEGVWNGLTGFIVTIYDPKAVDDTKSTTKIERLVSKSNLWGYATADAVLRESYILAMQDLMDFIDQRLME